MERIFEITDWDYIRDVSISTIELKVGIGQYGRGEMSSNAPTGGEGLEVLMG